MVKTMFKFFRRVCNFFRIFILICKYGEDTILKDSLTQTYNRMLLKEFAEREIKRAERYKRSLCCIMVDVDGLKTINDENGHLAGDKALRIIARILKESCRQVDLVFRFGGDEFIILMPESSIMGLKKFFGRIEKKLDEFSLSVSMGSCFWKQGMILEELLKQADINLYKSKRFKKKPDAI